MPGVIFSASVITPDDDVRGRGVEGSGGSFRERVGMAA
jgi:hypothetical protein